MSKYNVLDVDSSELELIVNAYKSGRESFTLNGEKKLLKGCSYIKIYKNPEGVSYDRYLKGIVAAIKNGQSFTSRYVEGSIHFGFKLTKDFFIEHSAIDITKDIIGSVGYGDLKEEKIAMAGVEVVHASYVDKSIIEEIRKLPTVTFDFSKLLALLNEINENYNNKNYYSVAFLLRSTLDHVPPLFAKNTFAEVCNQHPFGKSDKNLVLRLQNLSRDISDRELHTIIAKKVPLITETEIDFKHSLAALLKEIVRLHH
ncbi:MAG: hypothetical protein M0D57_19505 [Sphingobacteriales bacterium JAD_PAG50586_3]|nr:MAG: hypothetical protein M0D57_19505 [Sphingobacteriales bacterium JAD_PAG50586_3]